MEKSKKKYAVAVCLSGIFGILGIHHFYLNRWLHGFLDLGLSIFGFYFIATGRPDLGWLLLGIDILHTIVVTIMLLIGTYKDGEGNIVTYPGQTLANQQQF
ncbi:TM2 domain-containing protein [Kangiella sp. M94]